MTKTKRQAFLKATTVAMGIDMKKIIAIIRYFPLLFSCILSFGETLESSLINKDRIWHYSADYNLGTVVYEMKFGEDTLINDIGYVKFSTINTVNIHSDATRGWVKDSIGTGSVYYMREEGERVYIHKPLGTEPQYQTDNRAAHWPYEEDECLIYDWSLKPGDSFKSVDDRNEAIVLTVINTFEWTSKDGIVHKCQSLNYSTADDSDSSSSVRNREYPLPFVAITGIGASGSRWGWLAGLQISGITGMPYFNPPYPSPWDQGELTMITNLEGNIIYTPDMLSGIEELNVGPKDDGILYDLMGVPVTNPQPGSIYIRNGKKFVMK